MKKLFSAVMLWLLAVLPMMADNVTVYFDNSASQWGTVGIHYWGGGGSTNWENDRVTGTAVEGYANLYSFSVPMPNTGFLFRDFGSNQTGDLSGIADGNVYDRNGYKCKFSELTPSQGGEDPQPSVNWPVLYVRGNDVNGYGYSDDVKFANDGEGNYSLTLGSLSGQFCIANDDWSKKYCGANLSGAGTYTFYTSGSDAEVTGDALTNVTITFNLAADNLNPSQLSVTFTVPTQGGEDPNPGEDPDPVEEVYVLYDNGKTAWATPYVWAWNDVSNVNCTQSAINAETNHTDGNGWPGDPMTLVEGTIWRWDAPAGRNNPNKILFSNNGSDDGKTADLDFVNGKTYGEPASTQPDPDPDPQVTWPTLYLHTSGLNWGYNDATKFAHDGNGHYSLTMAELSDEFVIAEAGWGYKYGTNSQAVAYGDLTLTAQHNGENFFTESTLQNVTISFTLTEADLQNNPETLQVTFSSAAPAVNDKERVYYRNTDGWDVVCVHAYNGNANCTTYGSWPGDQMTYLEDCGLWYWEVPGTLPAYVMFNNNNNGSQHPANVGFAYAKGHIYDPSGDTGETSNAVGQGGSQGGETSGLTVTGTLPVLYINVYADAEKTEYDNAVIDYNLADKDYRAGEYWLTVPEGEEYQWMADLGFASVGSEDAPLALEIKARGNATRTDFAKKPFKLKLGKKADLLGLTPAKSKHYALLAHADDDNGFMRNFVGFNLGKRIGLPWTPGMQPVEVVINGDYRGLYFLTESIRVGDGRVDIQELKDEETSISLISGGYMVEFDNYPEYVDNNPTLPKKLDTQIWVEEGSTGQAMYINFDTPEVLSEIQKDFLLDQFVTMNNLIKNNSDDLWAYLDLDDAARYYVIMEVCSHWESYHGSTYLYRDRGEGQKWHFSPLWDMGHAFGGPTNEFFYQSAIYGNTWIKDLKRNAKFNEKVSKTWQWFINSCYPGLLADMEAYKDHIKLATANDWQRWKNVPMPNYIANANVWGGSQPKPVVNNSDMDAKYNGVVAHLNAKINWLKYSAGWGDDDIPEPARDNTEPAPLPDWAKAPELPNVEGVASKTLPVVFIATKPDAASQTYDVYFDNSVKNWSEVAVWAWSSTANCTKLGHWPGDKMVDLGNGLWGWNVPTEAQPERIMFNNNRESGESTAGGDGAFYYTKGATYNFNGKTDAPIVEPVAAAIGYDKPLAGTIVIRDLANDLDLLGSAEAPVDIETISGAGKLADWNAYEKKAYKVKLASKAKGGVLGMSPAGSKHWSLMPYVDDAANGLLTNYAAHLVAEAVGMEWTPAMKPVELVIDGDYKGLYFLVETIHIDDDRINTVTDYDKKAFALGEDWLIEFNDDADAAHKHYTIGDGDAHHVTSHVPDLSLTDEELAAAFNKNYTGPRDGASLRTSLGESVDALLTAASSNGWAEAIDPLQAARYYIVQEVMDAADAFNTSFYAYHGQGGKWMLGPVWDFSSANAQDGVKDWLLHEANSFNGTLIGELWSKDDFQTLVKAVFTATSMGATVGENGQNSIRREGGVNKFTAAVTGVSAMGETLAVAVDYDAVRWPQYAATSEGNDMTDRVNALTRKINGNLNYLASTAGAAWYDESLTTGIDAIIGDAVIDFTAEPVYYDLTGRRVEQPATGLYIERRGNSVRKVVIK